MADDVKKVEKYVDFLAKCLKDGHSNISKTENINSGYKNKKEELAFNHYVRSGDIHYFVSRTLFLSGVCEYSFFTAQQCIELYLKAYIKYKGNTPPNGHVLSDLVNECKKIAGSDDFIKSDRLITIAERFNPFYEYARYPVQKNRPQNGTYSFIYPDDIQLLDYFVYKMREIISYPENSYDILKEGKLQNLDTEYSQNIEAQFRVNNINFT
jgi:HEPN domain-containing protein